MANLQCDTKVEVYSSGIKELNKYNRVTNSAAAREYLQRTVAIENANQFQEDLAKKELLLESASKKEGVYLKQLSKTQIMNKVNSIYCVAKESILKEILFEMYNKSLYLDDYFKDEHQNNLRAVVDSYITGNGGMAFLESAISKTNSPLLRNIKTICEATARKVCNRKMKEVNEDGVPLDELSFDMNEDEKDDFDLEKEKLNIDDLSDLVKKKVLTVIEDEKTRQEKMDQIKTDIESELTDNPDVKTEQDVQESLRRIAIAQSPVEETTLFDALMRHSYKELLESVATMQNDQRINDEMSKSNSDINTDIDDIKQDEFKEQKVEDIIGGEYDLEKEISAGETDNNDEFGQDELQLDMDMVLAESISKYTIMELAATIQLETYTPDVIRKISQNLLLKK